MKKLLSIVLVTVLTLATILISSTGALAQSNATVKEPEFIVVKDTKKHKVITFKNKDKLEIFNENGKEYSIVETEGKKLKVFKEGDQIFIVDTSTNETVQTVNIETEAPALQSTSNSLSLNATDSIEVGTNAVVTDPGSGTKYKYSSTAYLSMDIVGFGVSVLAGLIAAAIGLGVASSVLVGIASSAVSLALPKLYWKRHVYTYTEYIYRYTRWFNQFYKYHDYTGYLGSEDSYTKSRVGI